MLFSILIACGGSREWIDGRRVRILILGRRTGETGQGADGEEQGGFLINSVFIGFFGLR
jgi:hypothetical protein